MTLEGCFFASRPSPELRLARNGGIIENTGSCSIHTMISSTMLRTFLRSKLHRVTVTQADLNYEGSISIDPLLLDAADIAPFELVDIYNITNGNRLSTYAIVGEAGSGEVCINGAAAKLVDPGDKVIICCYGQFHMDELANHKIRVVLVNEKNAIAETIVTHCSENHVTAER